jgi:DNA-binding transcriptional LysR family regulator
MDRAAAVRRRSKAPPRIAKAAAPTQSGGSRGVAAPARGWRLFDYEDLQSFVSVADAGGITPAARRLGLSKSVVSRRLARLEGQLGVQLLARTTRGAALTDAGMTFRDHAARVVGELDLARETVSPDGALRGTLRVAAPLSLGAVQLAPVFAMLAIEYPRLNVDASYSDAVVDIVSEGYDAAVRIGHLADSSLVARRLGQVRAHFVASPDYAAREGTPASLDDIYAHEALTLRSLAGDAARQVASRASKKPIPIRQRHGAGVGGAGGGGHCPAARLPGGRAHRQWGTGHLSRRPHTAADPHPCRAPAWPLGT